MLTQYADPPMVAAPAAPADKRYLYGPVVDFLCLGGSSLFVLPLLLLVPAEQYRASVAALMLLVAHFINHPHFGHSYQIFYRRFRTKAFTPSLGRTMQARYVFAGIIVPVMLVAFCAYAIARGDARLLGLGGNFMALFVGWHYVKQGYGMLMVDAALKRRFFNDREKKIFLVNCYAVWGYAWLSINATMRETEMWGLHYYSFAIPAPIVTAAAILALMAGAATLWTFAKRWRSAGSLPANGVMAYLVSLYLWLAFVRINPLWLLVVPAFHSLQYLVVVWRYQSNYEKAQLATDVYKKGSLARAIFGDHWRAHLGIFAVSGVALGFLGFWGLPLLAKAYVPYDAKLFGGALFLFVFWIAINVHHYFLDNVMWRRENPDTRRYLFG
ncbi:hypothetical protein SH591_09730 [Sphingomonas sp. LY54]|uniref:hypothetical protein n=1 Tax=Sphingomonas sp. LY54 TaxID=3095343 RepID=UPI002D786DD2|nr:hypothetical protein [Sphingomonas sp. LY54]WRP27400.1 hypothetical protein SH591_09730 [Sphingomonas sp. LY54]